MAAGAGSKLRLVHLSDVHFGGYGKGWDPNEDQRRELLLDLGRLVAQGGSVDGVIVGGDIAFHGQTAEYKEAAGWLDDVCKRGGCLPGRIWVVPGNHDIDRTLHKATHSRASLLRAVRSAIEDNDSGAIDNVLSEWFLMDPGADGHLACLSAYNDFAREYACTTTAASPAWTDLTLDLDGLDVELTGLNSVLASDTTDQETKPSLVLGRRQCELARSDGRVHIAFMHHPPSWFADWDRVEPYLRRAHLLLFGHEHEYKAVQRVEGQTVEVHAGAVGPHAGEGDDYVPSWNMITLERDSGQLIVTIEPRMWVTDDTCFGPHPDGVTAKNIWIDLQAHTSRRTSPEEVELLDSDNEEAEGDFTSANPLVRESKDSPGNGHLPAASARSTARELTVAFLKLNRSQQNQIAAQLSLSEGLADVEPNDIGVEILRRVREANKIDELAERLGYV